MPVVFTCGQIAPAEGMDPKQRMVIIAGPPEAQFKVKFLQTVGKMLNKTRLACFSGQFASLLVRKRRLVPGIQPVIWSPSCPAAGSVSHLWQTERRELLWTQRGGEAGGSHQGSLLRRWKGHREGWQDGKQEPRPSRVAPWQKKKNKSRLAFKCLWILSEYFNACVFLSNKR